MVEINSKLASVITAYKYSQSLNNENTKSQADRINENNRMVRDQSRGFDTVNEENFENFNITFPNKAEINFVSNLQELNSDNISRQRALNDRRYEEELRNLALHERGIGLNINVLI